MNHPARTAFMTLAAALLWGCGEGSVPTEGSPNVFRVARGDLRITIKEAAELKAARETRVKSEVEGQNTLIYLIPEGSIVEKGDRLAEIDASALVERQANQKISVRKAESALVQAKKNMEILQKELMAERSTAESQLKIAEMELEKFLGRLPAAGQERVQAEGSNREMILKLQGLVQEDFRASTVEAAQDSGAVAAPKVKVELVDPRTYAPLVGKARELLTLEASVFEGETTALNRDMGEMANQVLQQIDSIRLAMADLKVKEDTYGHSLNLRAKEIITQNELDRDELAFQSQASKVTLAWNDLDLLINYTLAKQKIELMQDVMNAQLELDRVIASNQAREAREEAELESAQAEYDLLVERLENLDKQINNAVILAPTPGLVVYEEVGRRDEMVEEGMSVRERQTLITLPDTTRMQAELKVQEADIDKVAPGQPAVITVDSSSEIFYGAVARVAPVPDSGSRWSNNDRKVYKTWVDIRGDNTGEELRPNMSATVEIVVAVLEDTLPVPLQTIRRDRSVNYVWKLYGAKPVATAVEIGRSNATHVEILSGVEEGDLLLLAPPAGEELPRFPQPEGSDVLPVEAASATQDGSVPSPAVAANGGAANGDGEQDGSAPQFDREAMRRVSQEVRDYLVARFPDRRDEIEDRRSFRQLVQEPEIQSALQDKPELHQRYQSMVEAMMERFRRGDPGMDGGERGGRRGLGGRDRGERPNQQRRDG